MDKIVQQNNDETSDEEVLDQDAEETEEVEDTSKPSGGKKPTTLEEALALINTLQGNLHKANREAARRRVEKRTTVQTDQTKLAELEAQVIELRQEREQNSHEKAFGSATKKQGIVFANDTAAQDASRIVREMLKVNKDLGVEDAMKQLLEERPYLVKKVDPIDTNDTNRGGSQDIAIDENAIAGQFGINYVKPQGGTNG
jgi:hypothetical protein